MPYLSHSNPTEAEIRDELTSVFPDTLGTNEQQKLLDDCVKAAVFLASTPQVEQQLIALEAGLAARAGAGFERALAHYRTRATEIAAGTLEGELRGLLSRELTGLEIRAGFNTFGSPQRERVQTYVAFVQPDSFRAQLRLGRHWKDAGVPGEHGEHTHRLQWHLLIKALGEGLASPVQLFMAIGGIVDANKQNQPHGLWDALFDRNDGSGTTKFMVQKSQTDARCPESLTRFVISPDNAEKWPLLHWYIRSRLYKRSVHKLNQFAGAKQYVERKIQKFGLNIQPDAVVGTWRQFGKNQAPAILQPGPAINRTAGH